MYCLALRRSGGNATHGNSLSHRVPGSIGNCQVRVERALAT